MYAVISKEINAFFSGITGYLIIAVFLILNGLFLWVFHTDFNILDEGFASLSSFFRLAPWILMLLIPAVTMGTFSEERQRGTLEILLTKPITTRRLVWGKYCAHLLVVLLTILPTLIYVVTLSALAQTGSSIDVGETVGSYLSLLLLAATFTIIGVFSSTLTKNQMVAFIIALLLCLLSFYAFDGITHSLMGSPVYAVEYLGIRFHYQSISRGVIDTRDLIYFFSVILLFGYLTETAVNRIKQ